MSEPSSDSAPQATGQCQQAYFLSIASLKVGPLTLDMSKSSTRSTTPTPPQFITGESPETAELLVMPVVPKVVKNCFSGATKPSSDERTVFSTSLSWDMIFFVGRATTALSRFEPMTAPTPERAASRPRSLQTPAMSDSCSPPGPISATLIFLPSCSFSRSSQSIASMPQYSEASRSSTVSSSM